MNAVSDTLLECASPAAAAGMPGFLGESAVMQQVFRLIERVASTEANVFLTGESGSGKELAARSIHVGSRRRSGPFIVVSCGAIPVGLIEAELFGSDAGLDPVTQQRQVGAFERADGGTLMLDEVTELPMDMQMRLLRVLETRKFYRLGASSQCTSDVRLIAATNRCPLTAVKDGCLRQDLLYRLAVFPIEMPPLRDRAGDVSVLAEAFLAELNAKAGTEKCLTEHARATLRRHFWPGNVRELKNCIERAFILGDVHLDLTVLIEAEGTRQIDSSDDQRSLDDRRPFQDRGRLDIRVGARIHDMERSLIEATLDHYKGNKRRAADTLGCSLKTLYNKLNGYSHSEQRAS